MKTIFVTIALLFILAPDYRVYAQENAASPPDSTTANDELTGFEIKQPEYDAGGKRDPFSSLAPKEVEEGKKIKELLNFEKAALRGIVKTADDKYALVIDGDGFGHVLREGYMVYGGYVTAITDDAVYLHIVKYGRAMTIVMTLETSKSTVISEEEGEKVIKRPGINISYEQSIQSRKRIAIEDIVVPSPGIKTIDELWFGKKSELPVIEKKPGGTDDSGNKMFSLFDPQNDSWIRLPYEVNWSNYSGKNVTYIVTIDEDSDFEAPFIVMEQVDESSYLLIEDMGLPLNRQLYWKVVAVDESGNERPCRQPYLSFKIAGNR